MDAELKNMNQLEEVINRAIQNKFHIGLFIEMPGFEFPELITNPTENLEGKLAYYKQTYDDNLNHKHAKGISIIGYTL